MQNLNLPPFDYKIREGKSEQEIFDIIRRKYFTLTPEEWVRQHFIHYLLNQRAYPAGRCVVEKEIRVGELRRRPDLVVYGKTGRPQVIAEFKAPSVKVDEATLYQAALYNRKLVVPYLFLSNGMDHYCLHLDRRSGKVNYLDGVPEYNDLEDVSS